MLKSLILFTLALNIAFAKDRFSDVDKKRFLDDVRQEIAEHKIENKGHVDLQIIKPGLYAELEEFLKQEKFTREEMLKIKQRYEEFSKDPRITPDNAEDEFYGFMEKELNAINKKPLERVKEGNICNNWGCADGLKCAPDPLQAQAAHGKLKKAGASCTENSECASMDCVEDKPGSKKKVCEDVYRCFRVLGLGESCMANPVCGSGACLPFNSMTSGIGECEDQNKRCNKNSDCCSNSCRGGVCQENYICKDCVENGNKPNRGQKCCEGLYMNQEGLCVPDVPPSVIPQVRTSSPFKSIVAALASFFISSADASELDKIQADFDAVMDANEGAAAGTKISWGNGTVTVLSSGNVSYVAGSEASLELTEKSNVVKVAQNSPTLRQYVIETYGIDPLGTNKTDHATNAATIEVVKTLEANKTSTTGTSTTVDIIGYGKLTYTYAQGTTPGTITSPSGKVYNPASDFYTSNEYSAMVGKKMTNADYETLQAELNSATTAAKEASKAASAAAALEDEESFLNTGAVNDGLNLKSGIMANPDKYSNFSAESEESEALDMNKKKAVLNFPRRSNFVTCDIRFKDDFYNSMKAAGTFDLEVAMLGFDFVSTGDSDNDYWRKNNSESTSVAARMKKIGIEHRALRQKTNEKIATLNDELTCMCLDVMGYDKIANDEKKKFFVNKCPEYEKYKNPDTYKDELAGDASGLKAKRLIVAWTNKLANFHANLAVNNSSASKEFLALSTWVDSSAKWNQVQAKKYNLFKFNIKGSAISVSSLGALVGALLAAGVIAILGGFATTSILSAWGAAGIISASAVTGAGGLWMIATLKGAWISMKPEINDYDVAPRTYSCGKKESCTEYTRTLVQPYNNVCATHASANSCIKSFVVVNEGSEPRYIVDPLIPFGVSKASILMNQPDYAKKINEGFEAAKAAMNQKNPGATGGGGKKGGGDFVSSSYLSEIFIDAAIVGQYAPAIGQNLQGTYFLNQAKIKIIKDAAKKFAISEGFLEERDTDNLDAFADYAYEYHFLWPKKSRNKEVSYPTVGLSTYLTYMTNDVTGNLSTSLTNATAALNKLHAQHLEDYKRTLQLFAEKPINQADAIKKANLAAEIAKTQSDLNSLMALNTMMDNKGLDSQLMSLNDSFINSQGKLGGAVGDSTLSADQKSFLKAVGELRARRKSQLKSLANYKKAMAANGNKDRAEKMEAVSKKFSQRFATGKSALGKNGLGSGFGSVLGSGSGFGSGAGGSNSNNGNQDGSAGANKDGLYGSINSGIGASGLYGSGSGSGSGSGAGAGGTNSGDGSNGAGADGAGTAGMSEADRNKLAEAINARNRNKDKYDSNEDLTLFEQVTNAYIRNYDKVLTKRKDKDVIEEKQ